MDSGDTIKHLETVARMLRGDILQQQKWSLTGSFEVFRIHPYSSFFLTHLLSGSYALEVSGMRDKEVNKMVDVECQFVVQNRKTDREVKHQPEANEGFKQTVKTPLSVGLPLRYSLKTTWQESRQYPIGCVHRNWLQIGPWHRKERRAECSSAYRWNGSVLSSQFC